MRESFEEHHQRHLSSTFPFAASAVSNQEAHSNPKPFSIEQGSLILRTGSDRELLLPPSDRAGTLVLQS